MTTPRLIKGWAVQATCPHCGGVLSHVADGRPHEHVSRAIARCTACGRTWAVQVTIADVSHELGRGASLHPAGCTCPRCVNARKTVCDAGHDLTPDNVYQRPDGRGRECMTCRRERRAAHYKEHAA